MQALLTLAIVLTATLCHSQQHCRVSMAPVATDVRFVAFGDFGTPERGPRDPQEMVAVWLKKYVDANPINFGLALGDNFYGPAVIAATSQQEPRWNSDWENLYGPLGVPFFAVLGNHDHPNATPQIEHTKFSSSWCMLSKDYQFKAGPIELFAIDKCTLIYDLCPGVKKDPQQLDRLRKSLAASQAYWKIVFGHHPIISGGQHGRNGELKHLYALLEPVLRSGKADLYIAGHDHDMELLKIADVPSAPPLHVVVAGSGGGRLKEAALVKDVTEFCAARHGFASFAVSRNTLQVSFINSGAQPLYSCALSKAHAGGRITEQCALATSCLSTN
jgi:tartrate-resistant acid phosphatase type 5